MLSTLIDLRDQGNTVLVVEHDAETILSSDFVVDMGPGAGRLGGEVVFAGPPEELLESETSITGKFLSGKEIIPVPAKRRKLNREKIVVRGRKGQ